MTVKIIALTEQDAKVLREFLAAQRRKKPAIRYAREPDEPPAPETYVALTPAGGIPAITLGVGTGTGSGPDQVAYADCDIYRVVRLRSFKQLHAMGITRPVHSLSHEAVPGGIYVLITRDKGGTWWVSGTPADLSHEVDPGTGTGTGTGVDPDCEFTEAELEELAGPGLGVDFTEDCPTLKVQTTPPECLDLTIDETDLRCERETGTGTAATGGSLNLYRRRVTINNAGGCLTKTAGEWEFIRAVACCDPECEQEESQEKFYWCINDGEAAVDPAPPPGDSCAAAADLTEVGTVYGPYTFTLGAGLPSKWFKMPSGLSGAYKVTVNVTAYSGTGGSDPIVRVWPGATCGTLGMGNSTIMDAVETLCLNATITTELWLEVERAGPTSGSQTYTVMIESGTC